MLVVHVAWSRGNTSAESLTIGQSNTAAPGTIGRVSRPKVMLLTGPYTSSPVYPQDPPTVRDTLVVSSLRPVMRPAALIRATVVSAIPHVARRPLHGWPAESVARAVTRTVSPRRTSRVVGTIATWKGPLHTCTRAESPMAVTLARTHATPADRATPIPALPTATTAVSELVHVTIPFVGRPLASSTAAVNASVPPRNTTIESGETTTRAAAGAGDHGERSCEKPRATGRHDIDVRRGGWNVKAKACCAGATTLSSSSCA